MQERKLLEILRRLEESKSQFIVVGGLAAVLNGAPVQTFDIDLVYSASPENIERLLTVLASLDAVFRIQPERRLKPTASHVSGKGHLNLITNGGPLARISQSDVAESRLIWHKHKCYQMFLTRRRRLSP